jgi:hypothetical protein
LIQINRLSPYSLDWSLKSKTLPRSFVEPASGPATSTERQPRESQTPQLLAHHAVPAKIPPDDSSEFDLAQRLPSEAVVLCRSSPTKESQWNSYQPQSK